MKMKFHDSLPFPSHMFPIIGTLVNRCVGIDASLRAPSSYFLVCALFHLNQHANVMISIFCSHRRHIKSQFSKLFISSIPPSFLSAIVIDETHRARVCTRERENDILSFSHLSSLSLSFSSSSSSSFPNKTGKCKEGDVRLAHILSSSSHFFNLKYLLPSISLDDVFPKVNRDSFARFFSSCVSNDWSGTIPSIMVKRERDEQSLQYIIDLLDERIVRRSLHSDIFV